MYICSGRKIVGRPKCKTTLFDSPYGLRLAPNCIHKIMRRQAICLSPHFGAVRGIRTLATCNSTTPLAGAPLEPLGYHRVSSLSINFDCLQIVCQNETICNKRRILGHFLTIWGVVTFLFKPFLYVPFYDKKYNSPKKLPIQLAGEPLEPLGYFCISSN